MILTFSYEGMVEAVKRREKDVTRRTWRPRYAVQFARKHARWNGLPHKADVIAYDNSPRHGGKPFAKLRILSVFYQDVSGITPDEVRREGFPDGDVEKFLALWDKLHKTRECYRIEFELVEVLK